MKCKICASEDTRVVDSRPADDGTSIRRRRECDGCGRRFTTYEREEVGPAYVQKRDGTLQAFDPNRVRSSILKACEKRTVPLQTVDALVSAVEQQVTQRPNAQVKTSDIGEMVMEGLRGIDEVAYVRFASVYRQFKDIEAFREELDELLKPKGKLKNKPGPKDTTRKKSDIKWS